MTDQNNNPKYRRGVGIMLINKDKRVFVGKRVDNGRLVGDHHWQMPQGGIDSHEYPLDAAMRELREEIGTNKARVIAESEDWVSYEFPEVLQSTLWGGRFLGQTQMWFLMEFLGDDKDIDLDIHHAEFSEWKWVAPEELPDLIVGFKRDVYVQVIKAFAPFLK